MADERKLDCGTTYAGPIETLRLQIGGREVKVVRPADPDRLLNDPYVLALNSKDDYMPYWAYLWPGAFLLAEAVAAVDWTDSGDILEIGCGVGLAGLTALSAGARRVVFTDYDPTPLDFVTRSAAENGFAYGSSAVRRLDWREIPEGERYDMILGADVLYERRLVPLVAEVISRMLTPDGVALVAGPYRVATEDLSHELKRHGLKAEATPIESRDDKGRPVRGTLHRIRL